MKAINSKSFNSFFILDSLALVVFPLLISQNQQKEDVKYLNNQISDSII